MAFMSIGESENNEQEEKRCRESHEAGWQLMGFGSIVKMIKTVTAMHLLFYFAPNCLTKCGNMFLKCFNFIQI